MNLFFFEQSKELAVMATAALPIIELRGAIPFGIALGLTPTYTFLLSLFGSMIPVPLLIWLIRPVFAYMRRTDLLPLAGQKRFSTKIWFLGFGHFCRNSFAWYRSLVGRTGGDFVGDACEIGFSSDFHRQFDSRNSCDDFKLWCFFAG